jgi:hypothetical protein
VSILSDFEDRIGRALEGGFARVFRAPVQPAELARKLGKEMDRGKKLGVGKVYAPTLYNILLSRQDDQALGGFADTLSGELETYLISYAREHDYELATRPVVRFLIDKELKLGRFEIIGEWLSPEELAEELGYTPDEEPYETPREPSGEPYDPFEEPEPLAVEPIAPVVPEPVAVPPAPEPFAPAGAVFDAEALDLDFVPNVAPAIAALEAGAVPTPVEPVALETPEATPTTVLPAAESPSEPLATVTVRGVDHDVVLRGARLVVGRLQQCDICLADVNASREHSAFERDGDGWAIRDLGSTNGTNVNGERITRQRLRDGDVIVIGITELIYHEPKGR